jgi:diaminopimelate decarboxylase
VLLVANAGAYGRAMSSSYNLRPPAAEYLLG